MLLIGYLIMAVVNSMCIKPLVHFLEQNVDVVAFTCTVEDLEKRMDTSPPIDLLVGHPMVKTPMLKIGTIITHGSERNLMLHGVILEIAIRLTL